MSKLYLNGVLCNGSGRGPNEYKVEDLKRIAAENGVSIPSGTKKEDICKLLLASGIGSTKASRNVVQATQASRNIVQAAGPSKPLPASSSGKKTYNNIEELMIDLGVENAMDLIDLSRDQFEQLILITKLHKNTMEMSEYLRGYSGSERAKRFLIALAEKYCRCLKGMEEKSTGYVPTAVCTKSVFTTKGLKGPGSAFQCTPTPLLLAPKGKKIVLEKKE